MQVYLFHFFFRSFSDTESTSLFFWHDFFDCSVCVHLVSTRKKNSVTHSTHKHFSRSEVKWNEMSCDLISYFSWSNYVYEIWESEHFSRINCSKSLSTVIAVWMAIRRVMCCATERSWKLTVALCIDGELFAVSWIRFWAFNRTSFHCRHCIQFRVYSTKAIFKTTEINWLRCLCNFMPRRFSQIILSANVVLYILYFVYIQLKILGYFFLTSFVTRTIKYYFPYSSCLTWALFSK